MTSPMKGSSIIAIAVLLGMCRRSSSWVLPRYAQLVPTRHSQCFGAIYSRPDIFYEDEFDCAEEDECEIDWGIMPGFEYDGDNDTAKQEFSKQKVKISNDMMNENEPDCPDEDECEIDWGSMPGFEDDDDDDDDDDTTKQEVPKQEEKTTNSIINGDDVSQHHLIGDETEELEPQEAYVRQVERSLEKSRKIFEMNWQIENCIVDEDTCADFCSECAGSGTSRCKFCRGTRMISFKNEFRPCLICSADGQVECSSCSGTGSISPWAKTHDGDVFRRSDN